MTRARLVNACLLAGIAALAVWVAFHTYWAEETLSAPLQGDALTNPYYSVERVARALGIQPRRVASLRRLPAGNGALLTGNLYNDVSHADVAALERWVEAGGRLIISGATLSANASLQTWSGVSRKPFETQPTSPVTHPAPDPACTPMRSRQGRTAAGEALWICTYSGESLQSTRTPEWALSTDTGPELLRVRIGRGSLTVIGPSSLLTARSLLQRDDARAFLEAARLQRGENLWIFSAAAATPLPALLWGAAAPAIVCFALAILLSILRNLPRFGPPAPVPATARRSLAEQIRANAAFAWRMGDLSALHRAVLRALELCGRQSIPGYGALDARARAEALGSRAGVAPEALLAAMIEPAAGRRAGMAHATAQRAAIALLEQTRRAQNPNHDRLPRRPA